jgi:steroid 5-alpha reductase family enzyme
MKLLEAGLIAWAAMAVLMFALWRVQAKRHNAGLVDIAWSFGTGLCAIWLISQSEGENTRRMVVAVLAFLWGARLASLFISRLFTETEDGRYQGFRKKYGDKIQTFMFKFFQIQALWAVLFALPMTAAAQNKMPFGILDFAGIAVWIIAVGGESIADSQLAKFKHSPNSKGKVCQDGLWKYSRHPNYFFEWLHWFSYLLLAMGGPWWPVALGGVVIMYWFLNKVTGVPYTEEQALKSRGDAYREYQRTTSVFFLWPPKREVA